MDKTKLAIYTTMAALMLFAGCSSDTKKQPEADLGTSDTAADVVADLANDAPIPDVAPDVQVDVAPDAAPDLSTDTQEDVTGCVEGQARCTPDALQLETCTQGQWLVTECMREFGQLCE